MSYNNGGFPAPRKRKEINFAPKKRQKSAWSHQSALNDLVGKQISICMTDGSSFEGQLLAADQFTLKIQTSVFVNPSVFFKSAIAGFREV